MAKKHTIDTLTSDVQQFKASTNKRLGNLSSSVKDMQPKVQEMHEFIIDQRGFERGQGKANRDGTININKDVWSLIVKLVVIIGAILGITKLQ